MMISFNFIFYLTLNKQRRNQKMSTSQIIAAYTKLSAKIAVTNAKVTAANVAMAEMMVEKAQFELLLLSLTSGASAASAKKIMSHDLEFDGGEMQKFVQPGDAAERVHLVGVSFTKKSASAAEAKPKSKPKKKGPYCKCCNEAFETVEDFKTHKVTEEHKTTMKTFLENKTIRCNICDLDFKSVKEKVAHKATEEHKSAMEEYEETEVPKVKIAQKDGKCYCSICDLKVISEGQFEHHCSFPKHDAQVLSYLKEHSLVWENGLWECEICNLRCRTDDVLDHVVSGTHKVAEREAFEKTPSFLAEPSSEKDSSPVDEQSSEKSGAEEAEPNSKEASDPEEEN